MALGSRKVTRPVPRRQRPRSCVWWFLFGNLVGGFGVGAYWMTVAPEAAAPTAALPKTERPTPPPPIFNFPNILKEMEVKIGDDGKPLPPPAPRPEPPPKPTPEAAEKPATEAAAVAPAGTAILQIASFKTAKDAEHLKAQLALLGISTRVQSATLKDGAIWHRVVTGPMNNKKELDETRAMLKKHGKDAIEIKVQ